MSIVTVGSRLIPTLCRGNSFRLAQNTVLKATANSVAGVASINSPVQSMSESDTSHQSQADGYGHTESEAAAAADVFRNIVISRTSGNRFSDREVEVDVLRDIMALTQR